MWDKSGDVPKVGTCQVDSHQRSNRWTPSGRHANMCSHAVVPCRSRSAHPVRGAPRALGLLLPGRCLAACRARRAGARSRVPRDGAHRSRLRRRFDGVRACRRAVASRRSRARRSPCAATRSPPCIRHRAGISAATHAGGAALHRASVPERDEHLTLLVESRAGWRNLCELLTRAHAHTRDHPQRERTEPSVTLEEVAAHAEGLICLSGCAAHGIEDHTRLGSCARRSVPTPCGSSCSGPTRVTTARGSVGAGGSRAGSGVPVVVTGNVHAHDRRAAPTCRMRSSRRATASASMPARRCGAATTVMCSSRRR